MNKVEPVPWRGIRLGEKVILIILPLLALMVLILPFLDQVILRRLARLPGMRPIVSWLINDANVWILGAGLLLLFVLVTALVRHRLVNNTQLWFGTGCPQCKERELVRVTRNTSDRFYGFIGVPAYRYACRNCTWRGLRIARREHSPEHEAELEASLVRFDPYGVPPNWPVAASGENMPELEVGSTDDSMANPEDRELSLEGVTSPLIDDEERPLTEEVEPVNHQTNSEPVEGTEWIWRRPSD